jgi:hypothetical protein
LQVVLSLRRHHMLADIFYHPDYEPYMNSR